MEKLDLESRFHRFARQLPGAECIDDLPEAAKAEGPRADYLWRERSVVVELKAVTVDPQDKLDQAVAELSERPDFPIFVGPAPVDKILRHIPDRDVVLRQLNQKVMRSIEGAFRSAKHQIANSRTIFDCPEALGLMVVLNQDVATFHPNDLVRELSRLMERRQGEVRAIDAIWLLSEAHLVSDSHPCIIMTTSRVESLDWAGEFLDNLNAAWAKFHNVPLIVRKGGGQVDLVVDPKGPKPGESAPRHEHWRAQYRANRYLEQLPDEKVFELGQQAFAAVVPYFLKGGPRKPFQELEPLFVRWTHFLEEAALRGLDMRGFAAGVELPPGLGGQQ